MPLAINNGTSLNPQPPAAPPGVQTIVDIPHRAQEGIQWCWAACVQMVLEFYNKQKSQCGIVKEMLKLEGEDHECGPDFQSRGESCAFVDMAPTWRACGIEHVDPDTGHLDMPQIKSEIGANRPIQVGIVWRAPAIGGHSVLIKGWAPTSPETLLIDDPLRDMDPVLDKSGRATHQELLTAFGHGDWQLTWKNLQ